MSSTEIAFDAVARITGISKSKMLSCSRLWPIVEARMLFVLILANLGQNDQKTAWALRRTRTTVLKARHSAENYISVSKSFKDKFNKITEFYESKKSLRQSQNRLS